MRRATSVLLLVGLLAGGCTGAATADRAATLALDQLSRYEVDVNRKIRAEDDYYDEVMKNATARINRLRRGEHDDKLDALRRRFVEGHRGASVADVELAIPDFIDAALKDWADREASYEGLTASTQKALAESRKKLELEQAKIKDLKTKLRTLVGPGTTKDMLDLIVGFAKEVKTKYDAMQADTAGAATTASKATPETKTTPAAAK